MIFVAFPDKATAARVAGYVAIISDIFLRLIKMLIGPLVFSTLVVGIAYMGRRTAFERSRCSPCARDGQTGRGRTRNRLTAPSDRSRLAAPQPRTTAPPGSRSA